MDIVVCTDNNYVMPTGVLICSICENNKLEKITFHVIGDNALNDKGKKILKEQVYLYNQEVYFYTMMVNSELNSLLLMDQKNQPKHLTIVSYFRLFLATILPTSVEKVLYLDCDIIVRHSLKELWNTDITDYAIGSIVDVDEGSLSKFNRLRYPQRFGYFNSGVLLVNLSYWRKYNLQEEYISFLKNYPERILHHDQDVLNYVLRERKKSLHLKYNVQNGFMFKTVNISWEYENELNEAITDPYIIHYIACKKPWVKGCTHPYKSEYFKYRQLTRWKNEPLWECRVKTPLKARIRTFLVYLGIMSKGWVDYRNDLKPLN